MGYHTFQEAYNEEPYQTVWFSVWVMQPARAQQKFILILLGLVGYFVVGVAKLKVIQIKACSI